MRLRPALLSCALLTLASPAGAQEWRPGPAMPVTYSYNFDPTLSPDGKQMIFLKMLEGREQLFIASSDGGAELQLSHDSVDLEDPAWSPDGKSVAYVRLDGDGRPNALIVMDLATKRTRRLSPPSQSPIHPNWAADSQSILYCTNDDLDPPRKNNSEIYRVDVATGRVRTLIAGGVNTYPSLSPDGARIAFRKMVATNSEVFVANLDGSGQRNLTDHPAFEGWPAWSPDGQRIAFAANRNSAYQIFVMNPDGSGVRLVANTEGRATAPRWSPDGSMIYFTNCWATGRKRSCEIFSAPAPPR